MRHEDGQPLQQIDLNQLTKDIQNVEKILPFHIPEVRRVHPSFGRG